MGIGDVFESVAKPLGAIGAGIDFVGGLFNTAQSGYNLYKDINNIDVERQIDAQKELATYLQAYNKENADQQYWYNKEYLDINKENQRELMRQSQEYNIANMDRQFMYNNYLSSRARDIYALRSSGINPAQGSSTSAGSVSALGSSAPTAASVQASLPGAPTPPGVSASHYAAHASNTADIALKLAETSKTNEEAERKRIENKYADDKEYYQIQESMANMLASYGSYDKMSAEAKWLWSSLGKRLELLEAERKEREANAKAREQEGNAAENNAYTRYLEYEERVTHDSIIESIQQQYANIEKAKLQPIIKELMSRTSKQYSEAGEVQQKINWYPSLIESIIELNEANSGNVQEIKKIHGKDADYYEWKMYYDQAMQLIGSISNAAGEIVPIWRMQNTAFKAANKMMHKRTTVKTNGVNQQGYKTQRIDEFVNE